MIRLQINRIKKESQAICQAKTQADSFSIESASSLVIPAVAKINPGNAWPVFFARVIEGAFQGPVLPAIFSMAAKWIPRTEKTALLGIISAGKQETTETPE